jgi:poly-gamma-glutamate synthesis protein (capsule biosynthesis protein)
VTALVRATAAKMEEKGVLYPAQDIASLLRNADITHISNEVAFFDRCPPPSAYQTGVVFCSSPRYLMLLSAVGTDVVELTGNHFQDYGSEATLQTLALYDELGWAYFGGGRDLQDARRAAILEHNGNRIAFIGCNMPGPDFAWATPTRPGAAPCGDYAWIEASIRDLKAAGYFVIATFQYQEYYIHTAPENQVRDFARLAAAGADVVSGSQAHFPQAMAWQEGAFIHYGLGNLFFDQMDIPVVGTRRAFIDRYAIYEGRLIGIEFLTTMLEDWARPRPMTAAERASLLRDVFEASGWAVYP